MPVSFDFLKIGQTYERPFLAELWGYKAFQAISRGVVTPSGTNYIILFVTKEKQEVFTQYNDYLDGSMLYWEGEEKHGSDLRIIRAKEDGDEIHLFYREIHHSPFLYFGKLILEQYFLHSDKPSRFIYQLAGHNERNILEDIDAHQEEFQSLTATERQSILQSRLGQGVFRSQLINKWGGCSVTGLSNISLLRASHIKPWRDSNNHERLDSNNGLLLNPSLDHLFDKGFISFNEDGAILTSTILAESEMKILYVKPTMTLRKLTDPLVAYLDYHRKHVYKPY